MHSPRETRSYLQALAGRMLRIYGISRGEGGALSNRPITPPTIEVREPEDGIEAVADLHYTSMSPAGAQCLLNVWG